jgi:hypothetical protein
MERLHVPMTTVDANILRHVQKEYCAEQNNLPSNKKKRPL